MEVHHDIVIIRAGYVLQPEFADGCVVLPDVGIEHSQDEWPGKRIEFDGTLFFGQSFRLAIHGRQGEGVELMGLGIIGIEFDGALGFRISTGHVPAVEQIPRSHAVVGLGQGIVEFHGFAGGLQHLRHDL